MFYSIFFFFFVLLQRKNIHSVTTPNWIVPGYGVFGMCPICTVPQKHRISEA